MSMKTDCMGCCWMKKGGVIVWRCERTECGFWTFIFGRSEKILDTSFT